MFRTDVTLNIFRIRSVVGLNAQLVRMHHRLAWRASCTFKYWDGIPASLSSRLCSMIPACSHWWGQLFSPLSVQGTWKNTRSPGKAKSIFLSHTTQAHTSPTAHMISAAIYTVVKADIYWRPTTFQYMFIFLQDLIQTLKQLSKNELSHFQDKYTEIERGQVEFLELTVSNHPNFTSVALWLRILAANEQGPWTQNLWKNSQCS